MTIWVCQLRVPIPGRRSGAGHVGGRQMTTVMTTLNRTLKMGWWRRVGADHRHHDYESCALPLSYAANSLPGLTQKLHVSCLRVCGCPGQDTRTSPGRRAL